MSMLKISFTIPDDLMVLIELDLAYMQANSEIDHAFDISTWDGLHD